MLHERNVVVPWLVALLVTGALAYAQATSVGRLLRTMQVEGCTEAQRDAIALHLGLCDDVVSALAQSLDDAAASGTSATAGGE